MDFVVPYFFEPSPLKTFPILCVRIIQMKVSERAWSWQDRKRIPGQTAAELDDAWLQHAVQVSGQKPRNPNLLISDSHFKLACMESLHDKHTHTQL